MELLRKTIAPVNKKTPTVLVPYTCTDFDRPIAIFHLRPSTNKGTYESLFLNLVRSSGGKLIYLNNINARLMRQHLTYYNHSSFRLRFALDAKAMMREYPELIAAFEEKFHVSFDEAPIYGAYESLRYLKDLFPTERKRIRALTDRQRMDFLYQHASSKTNMMHLYAQTIRKVNGWYIVNDDLPHLLEMYNTSKKGLDRHTEENSERDFFVCGVQMPDEPGLLNLFEQTYAAYKENGLLIKGDATYQHHYQRETFHLSQGHIEALFDVLDYAYQADWTPVSYTETPLGQRLAVVGITVDQLQLLRKRPLLRHNGKLIHIIEDTKGLSLDECFRTIKEVIV